MPAPCPERDPAMDGAALVVALAAGCAEEWRSIDRPTVDVRGRVVEDGVPVPGGWIEFIPVDGARGDLRSSPLARDGSFAATRVARGRNVVRIVAPPRSARVAPLFQKFLSPIRPTVDGSPLILDLAVPSSWVGAASPRAEAAQRKAVHP